MKRLKWWAAVALISPTLIPNCSANDIGFMSRTAGDAGQAGHGGHGGHGALSGASSSTGDRGGVAGIDSGNGAGGEELGGVGGNAAGGHATGGAGGDSSAGERSDQGGSGGRNEAGAPNHCEQNLPGGAPGDVGEAGATGGSCFVCRPGEVCYEPRCGDGHVDNVCLGACWRAHPTLPIFSGDWLGESCDDGNTVSGDGCSETCKLEPEVLCGNSRLDGNETCDDGNLDGSDGCDARCSRALGWRCEPAGTPCVRARCSDGHVDNLSVAHDAPADGGSGPLEGEDCDDGNALAGDGCDAQCKLEPGFVCERGGSCVQKPPAACGNLRIDFGSVVEQCDDGNAQSGDGCDAACQKELGWVCPRTGRCEPSRCGDGVLDPRCFEHCDDGNQVPGDGCTGCELDNRLCRTSRDIH